MIASSSGEVTSRQLLEQGDPRLTNEDLVPVPVEERNWTGFNFAALWAGMIYNIFGFTVIGGMMATGLSALQALLAVGLASVIQLVFLSLTGRVGTRLGIPFPVWARSVWRERTRDTPRPDSDRLVWHSELLGRHHNQRPPRFHDPCVA
jgi:cytosine/uracil/thiamine/allantoin permease